MKPGDEIAVQPTPAENGAAPRKPWRTPVVILESIDNQTTQVSKTGVDASATPFTHS
jgi:hypothetical protein